MSPKGRPEGEMLPLEGTARRAKGAPVSAEHAPEPPASPGADPWALDARAIRRAFGRAAATYADAAVLQREVGARMADRLGVVNLVPAAILDAGCGTGEAQGELALRYPKARRIALDLALPMLAALRGGAAERGSLLARVAGQLRGRLRGDAAPPALPDCVCGDIAALPFVAESFDLVWSNFAVQWIGDLPQAFAELRRVLKVGGLFTFTTFGPDTLKELRAAFAAVDRHTHVSRFVDMHDIGDLLVRAGFADPVMDMEYVTMTYADGTAMMRDLRAIGATNATQGRPRGLTGRSRWRQTLAALDAMRRDGRIPATFEVIYGHAWKAAPRRTAEGLPIVHLERGAGRSAAGPRGTPGN